MQTDKKLGFKNGDLSLIISVLSSFSKIDSAVIFGSRAKGNYRRGSDADIALNGPEVDFRTLSDVSFRLNEDIPLPYHFDVLNFDKTENPELRAHILRVGILIYQKEK